MDNKRRLTNKYILLAILLIAVFVLPSCRTRISNNSEIANVQYDEDGMMSETYQERRDELGLSTAEKPLLPNLGSAETDDNDDFAEGSESIDYNPEDFQEDFSEPETTTETNTNTNTNTNTGTRTTTRRTPTTTRRTTGTTTSTITITFDPKEGTIEGKKKAGTKEIKSGIKKNSSITPPGATREGYTLTGWKGSDGKTVKPGGKVTVTKTATYTAQWDAKGGGETRTITVTLNYNDEGVTNPTEITVSEGGKYEGLNDPPARGPGYTFKGWFDGNGNRVKNGDSVNPNITSLTAEWDYSPKDFWNAEFAEAANTVKPEEKKLCYVIDSEGAPLIDKCKGEVTSKDDATYIIQFIADLDDEKATNAATDIRNSGEYPNVDKVVLIDKEAIKAKDNKEIIYKMMILEELYGNGVWADKNAISKAKGSGELDTDGVKPITK